MNSGPKNNPIPLPQAFVRWAESQDLKELLAVLDQPETTPVSVRLNPAKKSQLNLPFAEPVPWAPEGSYLSGRPVFTADPVFHGGAYYVQEPGSMMVGELVRGLLGESEFSVLAPRILDLCAAPGGKTTHLATAAGSEGVVVANEVIRPRAKTLAENVQKWGTGNVLVTSNDPADFGERLPGYFDIVVVDAPCSGEGMFRKDPEARREWSPENVQLCAGRQRRILSDVWPALRDGGVLVYSTCTFNEAENEQNVEWLISESGGELIPVEGNQGIGRHFYPHQVRSEGFYVAMIRKNGGPSRATLRSVKKEAGLGIISKADTAEAEGWLDHPAVFGTGRDGMLYGYHNGESKTLAGQLMNQFQLVYSGIQMGELIRGELKPSHALALSAGLNRNRVATTELAEGSALEYLRKGTSAELLPAGVFREGMNGVVCRGTVLGWAKRIGNRYNNLYPAAWRILHY